MGRAVKPISTGSSRFNRASRAHKPRSPLDKAKAYEVVWQQVSGVFEAVRHIEGTKFVYVIAEGDDGPVKIGLSNDPVARLRAMQTGNPRRLRIEYVLIGAMELEKLLHELWEPFAIVSAAKAGKPGAAPGTEWFKPEAREALFPIIADAARRQIEHIYSTAEDEYRDFRDFERLVRDAHAESGFIARGRDEIRLLATNGADYIIANRASRI